MNKHKKQLTPSERELFERRLLLNPKNVGIFRDIKIFEPEKDYPLVDRFKDGTYGFSNTAITLYYHGNNPRGLSQIAPFGLLWHDGKMIFPFAYFKKEGEENGRGYLFVGHPKGEDGLEKLAEFIKEVLNATKDICKGAYVRFLPKEAANFLIASGFRQVDSGNCQWHQKAPMEDETRNHSIITLSELIERTPDGFRVRNLFNEKTGKNDNHRRSKFNSFANFLARNDLEYGLEKIRPDAASFSEQRKSGEYLIRAHFDFLAERKKAVGSVWQDYIGEISPEILSLPTVYPYIGYLCSMDGNKVPVSIFVAEEIGPKMAGHYASITNYSGQERIFSALGIAPVEIVRNLPMWKKSGEPEFVLRNRGFMAIALHAIVTNLARLMEEGFEIVKLGGSETEDHDFQKRMMGAKPDPTCWVYFGE